MSGYQVSSKSTGRRNTAHLWAHRAKPRGGRGNFTFQGDCIYSYGDHYVAGRLLRAPDGTDVALYNTRRYSVSTSGHVSAVCRAVSHLRSFGVFNLPGRGEPRDILRLLLSQFESAVKAQASCPPRAKVRAYRLASDAANALDDVRQFASIFNLKLPAAMARNADAYAARLIDLAKRGTELERRRKQRARAKALLDFDDRLNKWRGGITYSLGVTPDEYAYLRVYGDSVQTSKGADVSIESALAVLPLLQRARAAGGASFGDDGPRIGHYRVNSVTSEHVEIGCHLIRWSEIDAIATQLKGAEVVTA